MKKMTILLLMVTLATGALAQGVSFGIKAGLNFAKEVASGSGVTLSSDTKTGFHGGIYVKIMGAGKFGVQPELLYSGQGGGSGSNTVNYNYLNLPVMARYNITPLFNLQLGPQLGILMSATFNGTDVKNQLKSTDTGLAFGAGVDLPSGLNFAARYIAGLSDIQSTPTAGVTLKNQVIQISVGFKLAGI